jgi:NADH-quinone oxidoreductase subunit N
VPDRALGLAGGDHRPRVRPGQPRLLGDRGDRPLSGTPHVDWFALSPSLALFCAAGVALLAAVLVPAGPRRLVSAWVCALGYLGAFVAAALLYDRSADGHGVIADAIRRDRYAALAAMIVAFAGLVAVGVSYAQPVRGEHVAEYYALVAAAGAGMVFLAAANNLMVLFLSLEWFSLCLYILCAIDYELAGALEAGLKYLVVGGFGSAFLLFGSALVYGATGELQFDRIASAIGSQGLVGDSLLVTGLALVLVGLGYKASAAPFHMWTPDVYEGAPTPVTAFMSAATKTVALVLALRVLVTAFPQEAHLWAPAIAAIAICSLVLGNLAALAQRSVKRMLAYSSISHAGFMLIGVAANNALGSRALLYYLIPYSAMSVGSFAVVAARERELQQAVTFENLAGLGWERPVLGSAMATFMLGFAGLPPTGGFVGKFYVFAAAWERRWIWLVAVGLAATVVSLYYYLGVIRAMFMRAPAPVGIAAAGGRPPRELALGAAVVTCLVVTVASFVAVQPLIDLAKHAVSGTLPFPG